MNAARNSRGTAPPPPRCCIYTSLVSLKTLKRTRLNSSNTSIPLTPHPRSLDCVWNNIFRVYKLLEQAITEPRWKKRTSFIPTSIQQNKNHHIRMHDNPLPSFAHQGIFTCMPNRSPWSRLQNQYLPSNVVPHWPHWQAINRKRWNGNLFCLLCKQCYRFIWIIILCNPYNVYN